MKTKNESGRMFACIVAAYLIAKVLLNMVLGGGFSFGTGRDLLIAVAEAVVLFLGITYTNYIVAAVMVVTVLFYLKGNLENISGNLIYLIEGGIDVVCAVVICLAGNVREHFSNSLSDITGGDGN